MDYIKIAKEKLSKKRLEHTKRVIEYAKLLCDRYNSDFQRVQLSCWFHDIFREFGNLEHGPMAYDFMIELGIDDVDVLNAVKYHTTGHYGMKEIEKIVFLADALEFGRNFDGIDKYREISMSDLDKACLLVLESTVRYLEDQNISIHSDTYEAIKYFKGE